jgi:hypothetical protein
LDLLYSSEAVAAAEINSFYILHYQCVSKSSSDRSGEDVRRRDADANRIAAVSAP